MSESKHTPGPWYATPDPDRDTWWVSQRPDGGTFWVAEAVDGLMNDETETNARLIAAAPDLLEACKRALPYLRSHIGLTLDEGPGDRIALDMCEEAIAKATQPEATVDAADMQRFQNDVKAAIGEGE